MLLALCTRTWVTSISIALMITICYSARRGCQYFWLYHLYGWFVPSFTLLIVYFKSSIDRSKEEPILGSEKFGQIQIVASLCVLLLCVIISSTCLMRIARRSILLKHKTNQTHWVLLLNPEDDPLIENDSNTTITSFSLNSSYEGNLLLILIFSILI